MSQGPNLFVKIYEDLKKKKKQDLSIKHGLSAYYIVVSVTL